MGEEGMFLVIGGKQGSVATRTREPLPKPENVFVDWLVSVPPEYDLASAARAQIALIDHSQVYHPDLAKLRLLFAAICGADVWPQPLSNY